MAREEIVSFRNPRGQTLVGVMHHPTTPRSAAVILCHGMESSKESEKIVRLARQLPERGILALRFDFAGSGESEGKFEDVTFSGEVDDLRAAYEIVAKYPPRKIGVFGSSMGGTVALLFTAQERNIAALVMLAAPAHPERFTERFLTPEEARDWRERGYLIYHGRRLNVSLLEDGAKLAVAEAARRISCPALVIHGDRDDTVPVEEGRELYDLLREPKRLCILDGANHRLTEPAELQTAVAEAIDWLTEHLR